MYFYSNLNSTLMSNFKHEYIIESFVCFSSSNKQHLSYYFANQTSRAGLSSIGLFYVSEYTVNINLNVADFPVNAPHGT